MGRYQGLTSAFVERLDAAVASVRDDDYVPVPSPAGPLYDLGAMLDALRNGRPFSHLPSDHEARRLLPPPTDTTPEDPLSPGAMLESRLEQLRQSLANEAAEPPDPDVPTLEQLRAATVREIERENREREKRQRQKAKRARRAEKKKQQAATQDAASADAPM